MATVSDLQQLYIGYFGRAADQAGLNFWLGAINNDGLSLANVHAAFVNSAEYNAQYEGLTVSEKVAAVYENVLGRVADDEGLAFWTSAIEAGTITEDQLIEGLLSGLSPVDAQAISNKIIVANYYTSAKGDAYNEASKTQSADILRPVNDKVDTVAIALGEVAKVTGVTNAELATALANLEAAQAAKVAYAEAYVNDEAVTGSAAVTQADGDIAQAVTDTLNTLNGATTVAFAANDTAAVHAQKVQLAQTQAAEAVAAARAEIAKISGLTSLVNTYTSQLAAADAASKAADAALIEANAELASFAVIDGTPRQFVDAANGDFTVAGVIAFNATTKLYELNPAYQPTASGNITAANKIAAANQVVADVNAKVAADKALTDATTAVATTAGKITDLNANGLNLAGDLKAALDDQAALSKAITEYSEAKAIAAEWAAVGAAETAAGEVFEDLGYNLVNVIADVVANGEQDVFVFSDLPLTNNSAAVELGVEAGDVLFVGANYKLGVDSNLTAPGIQGGDNSAFEVFFQQDGLNAKVLVENSVFGSSAAGGGEFTTITLTGVNVDQLSFDAQTGLVSIAAA